MNEIRRNTTDIEAAILKVATSGSRKTHIVYGANLNFNIVRKYLSGLIERGLLLKDGPFYVTTDRGLRYLDMVKGIRGFQ